MAFPIILCLANMQMTTFSPLLLVSTQLVNVPLLLQNEFVAKYRSSVKFGKSLASVLHLIQQMP